MVSRGGSAFVQIGVRVGPKARAEVAGAVAELAESSWSLTPSPPLWLSQQFDVACFAVGSSDTT